MGDQKNLLVAVVLSIAILLGFDLFMKMRQPPPAPAPQMTTEAPATPATEGAKPPAPAPRAGVPASAPAVPGGAVAEARQTRAAILASTPRIKINTPRLHGSIALTGGLIDDVTLADYRETIDPKSPEIVVLSPRAAADAYFGQFGWVPATGVRVPGPDTVWTADRPALTPESPVTLRWDNGAGLVFSRTIAVDTDYMFTVTDKVENQGGQPVTLYAYGLVSRRGTPKTSGYYILHEGPLGVFNDTLKEVKYKDLREEGTIKESTTGGWIGITDKYWLTALVPDQKTPVKANFVHTKEGSVDRYQVDFLGPESVAAPKGTVTSTSYLFVGAKELKLLNHYEETIGVRRFDLAIDWGWFYFLTKPIFYALLYIYEHVGNFGIAILLLTVGVKLLFFPLANKSYQAMSKMKKLQPELTKLRERFGDDKQRLNQEMMELYKREKANPASGCLPIIIQIPVFFALYKVLFVTIEMRQAPFFGWIQDLSAPDPTTVFNLFGLIPWTPPSFLMIGVWPLLMGLSMFLQQKLNPQPTDPVQAKIFMLLPVVFTFLLARFPAGLVIYWAWNNLLSMLQQWVIMRRAGVV